MKSTTAFSALLSCIGTAAAWTTTDHWQTSVVTGGKTTTTTSISVFPTGSDSATSSSTSTTLFTSGGYTLLLTVHDLFYAPTAAVCTPSRVLTPCGPTPALSRTTGTITTTYWAPVHLTNPSSCTKTSFDYTTASTLIALPSQWIGDVAQQATQSEQALLVTTSVRTLSTNLGGQAVTTSVCDVYLRADAIQGGIYTAEATLLAECVDPRDYACRQLSSALAQGAGVVGTKTTCDRDGQVYPPTAAAGGPSPTKSSGVGGVRPEVMMVVVAGGLAVFGA